MTDWVTIEHINLRGGPRDGEQLSNMGAAGLVDVLSVPMREGLTCRYRKTDEYSQLRGAQEAAPYARIWFYDWLPDSDDNS
jgi:hypothetical protein